MTIAAVIVETRDVENLSDIIRTHMKFLPEDSILTIYHSEDTEYLKKDFPLASFILVESNFDIYEYNRLLKSADFWNRYSDFDRVLIFQSDSAILREGISDFYEWDYIGSSWKWNKDHCGNGGLSLRNPKVMLEIIEKFDLKVELNEDHWFTKQMFDHKIGKLAPIDIADKFACEGKFVMGTLGYHAIDKWLTEQECFLIKTQYN